MTDCNQGKSSPVLNARELLCRVCGERFLFRGNEQALFARRGWVLPKRCPVCRKAEQDLRAKKIARRENLKWQMEKAAEKELFNNRLKDWRVVTEDKIRPESDDVLYIIGNGFDLMHGVRSSYYAFRDSLGKQSPLRQALEDFTTAENVWMDFEATLAQFDMKSMCSSFMVDTCLDLFGGYDADAKAADLSLAAEMAAGPILTVANELPARFRRWVETLCIGTEDRPLRGMLRNGRVLCFNYTEFIETLYGVPEENVCYIHGCRRKKKYHQKEKLVLGHMPGASEEAYDFDDDFFVKTKNPYQLYLIDAIQEQVFQLISESDVALTKNCADIISAHEAFFAGLTGIKDVIVIGHSYAPVDGAYFAEIAARLPDIKNIDWHFGCHGLRDLEQLERLLATLGIERAAVAVFRTDDITVTPLNGEKQHESLESLPIERLWCRSSDGRWVVKTTGCMLFIVNQGRPEADYKIIFSSYIANAFFTPFGEYLFVVMRGADPGLLLFGITDGQWNFIGELENIPNQSLINPRLRHVFLTNQEITFVYNNHLRTYALADGMLMSNKALRNARSFSYDGMDICHLFRRR